LRFFVLVAAIGTAASLMLEVCSRQATAASVGINTGVASYSLGYITNTTITTNAGVTAAAASLVASPVFNASIAAVPIIPAATAASYGWVAPSAGSNWVGPNSVGTAAGTSLDVSSFFVSPFTSAQSAPQGFYYYTTTFSLVAPGPFSLSGGFWSSDNQGVQIFLNGFALGMTNPLQFTGFSPFTAPSADFVVGTNVLSFVTWNENFLPNHGSPSGIEVQGLVSSVPEPTAIVLVASGLPLIGLYYARRRRLSV